jgi:DNA polymerase-1
MFNQLCRNYEPTHCIAVFDGGLPDERTELLEDYKANRPEMPDSLSEQIETVKEYLDRADICWILKEEWEADDVMASLAEWAAPDADSILLATSDKDMFQLVDNKIKIVSVAGKQDVMGVDEVRDKTGVIPSQIVDWLALVGDNADNIPGVPGIGPKTAAELLNEYGSVKGVYNHIEEIRKPARKQALQENRDNVERNIRMVRLNSGIDCEITWEDIKLSTPDPDSLITFFNELEFHSMAKELNESRVHQGELNFDK